jgi:hypothetical protein
MDENYTSISVPDCIDGTWLFSSVNNVVMLYWFCAIWLEILSRYEYHFETLASVLQLANHKVE